MPTAPRLPADMPLHSTDITEGRLERLRRLSTSRSDCRRQRRTDALEIVPWGIAKRAQCRSPWQGVMGAGSGVVATAARISRTAGGALSRRAAPKQPVHGPAEL